MVNKSGKIKTYRVQIFSSISLQLLQADGSGRFFLYIRTNGLLSWFRIDTIPSGTQLCVHKRTGKKQSENCFKNDSYMYSGCVGGMVASWLVRSTPGRTVRVRDIVLCSCARHFTLPVPLSTQVYKWVSANCWGNLTIGLASRPGEVEILLAASRYIHRDKLRQL